jgi:hypothetical protein
MLYCVTINYEDCVVKGGPCVVLAVRVLFWRSVCCFGGPCVVLAVRVLFWRSVCCFGGSCVV